MLNLNTIFKDPSQLLIVPAALLAIMLHEISHGLVAYWSGDLTAKQSGRLSLNPIRHLDPFGLVAMVFFGFGWAKPVPVDMRYFKKPRRDFALVALGGPLSNFLQALVGFVIFFAIHTLMPNQLVDDPFNLFSLLLSGAYPEILPRFPILYVQLFLTFYIVLNVGLGSFNLLPIPPLDGSKIVGIVIPDRFYYHILRFERYGMIVLAGLLFSGVLDTPLNAMRTAFLRGIGWLAGLPFGYAWGI
ncbi:MAG: site-2 protease family protein [Oscillospiraceae bacterium]|nr:site-2 protease family protein [Oscillospiraceae bacterium]